MKMNNPNIIKYLALSVLIANLLWACFIKDFHAIMGWVMSIYLAARVIELEKD